MDVSIDPYLGHMIRGYRLEKVLKKETLMTTYHARTEEIWQPTELIIALLHISPFLSDHARIPWIERFAQEARRLSTLRHLSLHPLFGYGEEKGLIYLIFPSQSADITLAKRQQRKKQWNPLEIFPFFAPLCDAFDYIHNQGLIYQFLSPSNILLHNQNPPQITGTGLAQMQLMQGLETEIFKNERNKHLKNIAGDYISSSAYLAPEVIRGAVPDSRADIYSLGVILFELLAGRLPFIGKTYMETAQKHLREPLPSLHSITPNIPVSLELVINRALHRDPHYRFSTAGELIAALTQAYNKHLHEPLYVSAIPMLSASKALPTSDVARTDYSNQTSQGNATGVEKNVDSTLPQTSAVLKQSAENRRVNENKPLNKPPSQPTIQNDMEKMVQHLQKMRQRIQGDYHK